MSTKPRTPPSVRKQVEDLRREIRRHDHLYYVEAKPVVSDQDYDGLMKRLQELEEAHPGLVTPDSPTQRVGGEASGAFAQHRHAVPMLSLDNTYSMDDLREWHERVKRGLRAEDEPQFVVENKIDGVGLALIYEDGALAKAATRGDGEIGEDVTANARTLHTVPMRLSGKPPKLLEVRGEVYATKTDFERYNEQLLAEGGDAAFANPRNFAAGSLRQKDPRLTASRPLRFFVHSFGRVEGMEYKTHERFLAACKEYHLPVDSHTVLCKSIGEALARCARMQEMRDKLLYEADGCVVKVDQIGLQKRLGFTFKSPRWAVAYKFPAAQATTTIDGVLMSVGRTGAVTPVAQLAPVKCGGVTISNASLHNFDEIKRLDARVGDWVLVERAGEVIPKVIRVLKEKRTGREEPVKFPTDCPVCGEKLDKLKEEAVVFRCMNPACPVQVEKALIHFAGRDAMDIEGLGESAVAELHAKKKIRDLADLYRLTKEDLLELEGFKEKKAENLLAGIRKSRQRPLNHFIYALGIRDVGEKGALLLADKYGTLEKLLKAEESELQTIREVGPVMAESVAAFFRQPAVRRLLEKFAQVGVKPKPLSKPKGPTPLAGKTVVFTGELRTFSRSEAERLTRELGGNATSSVSKSTSFVVAGASPGSKFKKAQKLGVEVIDEDEFRKRAKIS